MDSSEHSLQIWGLRQPMDIMDAPALKLLPEAWVQGFSKVLLFVKFSGRQMSLNSSLISWDMPELRFSFQSHWKRQIDHVL